MCDFCETIVDDYIARDNKPFISRENPLPFGDTDRVQYLIVIPAMEPFGYLNFLEKIEYCPYCGRKLRKDNE